MLGDWAIVSPRDAAASRWRRPLAALLLCSSAAAGAQSSHGASPARPMLTVAVEDAADVWSRGDGTGFANDIVRAAFRAGGIEPEFRVVPYARCKAMVQEGIVAACFSMSRDTSIPPSVVFADSANYTFSSDFYERADRRLHHAPGAPLPRGSLVGVVRGYEYPSAVHELARRGVIRLVAAGSEGINLRKLVDGRLDAVMVNTDATKRIADLLQRAGVPGRVVFAARGGTLPAYVGFSMRHTQGADALARYNAGRRTIAANGVLAAIQRRWTDSIAAARRATPVPAAGRPPQ